MKITQLKSVLVIFLMTAFVFSSNEIFAQRPADKDRMQETPDYTKMSRDEVQRDFDSRMQKFDEAYNKLKQKESQITDPQAKADLQNMLSAMERLRADMLTHSQSEGTMSEEQKKQSMQRIRTEMEGLRTMKDQMVAKHGKNKGGKNQGDREQRKQQRDPEQVKERQPEQSKEEKANPDNPK